MNVQINEKKLVEKMNPRLRFSFQDLIKKNLRVGRLAVDSGVLYTDSLPKSEESSEKINVAKLLNSLPFRKIEVNNFKVESRLEGGSLSLKHGELFRKKEK